MTETQNGFQKVRSCTDPTIFPLIFHGGIKFGNTVYIYIHISRKNINSIKIRLLPDILKSQNIPKTLLKAIVPIHTQKQY